MLKANSLGTVYLIILSLSAFLLSSCGSGDIHDLLQDRDEKTRIPQAKVDAEGNYAGQVVIDLLEDSPKVTRQSKGMTNVVLQFVPRDNNGFSLSSDQIDISLKVDGKEIDIESHLQSNASELQFDVNFGLVLDTSYSMVDRDALMPMLEAAQQTVQSGLDIWKNKSSEFLFHTSWFNDYIYSAVDSSAMTWTADDLLSIPEPEVAAKTKLFAAVDAMVDKLNSLPKPEVSEEAPVNQKVILVFSDGEDNYSHYATADEEVITEFTNTGAEYIRSGYKAVGASDLLPKLENSSNLSVHVIGLGDTINERDLRDIAKSGNGTFRKNPDVTDLSTVFDSVVKEFTTLQTHGASMPLQDGNYTFTLHVANKSGNSFAEYNFDFNTSEEGASILPIN